MSALRLRLEWAVLLALAIAGALASQASGLTSRIDNQLLDTGAVLARPPVDRDIVIVPIDDRSLDDLGTWPWPRRLHARLVEQLTQDAARLVVLDILFPDPSAPQDDRALAEAISASGSVFLPHSFKTRANARSGVDPLLPLPPLLEASAGVGHVVAQPDADGVLRRFDLILTTDTGSYPHLASLVLGALETEQRENPPQREEVIIPFHPEDRFPHQPASQVLAGTSVPGFFKDKIVLVGATAQGLGDRYSVAAGRVEIMSGIGTQANLVSALRQGSVIKPVGFLYQSLGAAAAIAALFFAFWFLPPRYGLICAGAGAALVLIGSATLLAGFRLWFEPGSLIAALILAYPLWSWRRLSHVSRYLDREAARLMTPEDRQSGGEGLDYVTAQTEQLRRLISTVRGSLSFLQQVIEAAPDAIVVVDRDGSVDTLNRKALQLFPSWTAQKNVTFEALVASAGADLQEQGSEMASAEGGTFLVARAAIHSHKGETRAGEIIALRDVSDLRRLDNERKQMLEFLSHDMRTPQVAIVGLTSRPGDLPERSDVFARIRAQAERTLKLADDFVQLARLEHPSLTRSDSDIGSLVEEACDRAFATARAKGISIAQSLPDEPCFAKVDASLIARLLDNLISNAIKFSPHAGRVAVSLETCGTDRFTLQVSDAGPGLSKERLADPFARFGAHQTNAGPSSGLGLALVKKVVDAHCGEIALQSAKDEGTRVTITLPMDG